MNVTNCAITGNSSGRSDSFTNGGGGGIFNASNGTVNVTNSTFEFNQATAVDFAVPTPGGAIYNKTGFLNVTDSTFTSNNTTDSGGAVANEGGVVSITGSTFHDNGAFNRGGAISGSGGTVIVTNSTFYGNIAYGSTDGGDRGFGAAIANEIVPGIGFRFLLDHPQARDSRGRFGFRSRAFFRRGLLL